MSDVLHGIEEDVPFDNATADALIATCTTSASAIEGQFGSRASWVSTAMADFKGYFSGLFQDNANTAHADGVELANRLRETAKGAQRLKEEAEKEQQRREKARKWKKDQDNRSLWDKGVDSVFGEDKPPVGPAAEPVSIPISAPVAAPRQTPAPGSGGGGGGTSSAKPTDLTTFSTQSQGANDQLRSRTARLKSDLASFHSLCRWGTLDASGVVTGFTQWLAANDEDVKWAKVVADAFTQAGGSGAVSTLSNSALLATLASHGVNATRADLTIAGPVAVGHPPTTGYALDPVNTSTGNFVETETDLSFAGACSALALTRTYNSLAQGASLDVETLGFGPGWSSWTDARLRFDDQQARMVLPDGRQIEFPRLGAGWDRATGESLWLEADGATYVARGNAGQRWVFGSEGLLREQSTGPGTAVTLTWDERRLVRMDHERGRAVELTWSGATDAEDDRVTALSASDGRVVTFDYDERGRLVAATGPLGTRTYRWDDASGLLSAVISADGVVEADNVYDDRGRVTLQRSPHGRDVRFVYLPGRVTVVSDEDGTRSNTWIADQRGRLVGVVDADEQRQSMAYDAHGNLVMVTERDGATTVRAYDDRGRLVRTVAPTGADIRQTWDDLDRLLTVSAAAEAGEEPSVSTFEYAADEDRQPSVILDPEGGRSEMVWERGLLVQVTDPTGVVVRFTHDEHGDLVATTDALGNAARLERDDAGRVVSAVTPGGATTRFVYDDGTGLLAERVDPDGAVTRFEHTAAGQVRAVIDPLGARTELEYSDNGENTKTIDPLGRAVTRRFDDLGNLSAVELPDGSTWRYAHDALSRLREITDTGGGVTSLEFDETGVVRSAVHPDGTRVALDVDPRAQSAEVVAGLETQTTRYDQLGRLVATERPDGSTLLTRYDRCGRPVEVVDGAGGVTAIRRDAAGRAVAVTRPSGVSVAYEYDACGRPSAIVDELGGRTTLDHDADGRTTRRTSPGGESATWEYDECSRVVKSRVPGVGTSTWKHDLAGRVVESRDPQSGRRTFRYDAAGQLVEAVDAHGGSTHYDYDQLGRLTTTTDPLGARTTQSYDERGNLVELTDPLGRTMRAGYDAAGRQVWQTSPDGERTEWRHDTEGRLVAVAVDGRTLTEITRERSRRRLVVRDLSDGGREVVHELTWDARGLLTSRTRDGRGLRWDHDPDGRLVARTGPDGATVRYERDAAGRITAVDHPLFGRAVVELDADGRTVATTAGGLRQRWTHADGFVATYSLQSGDVTSETVVERDGDGRVVALDRSGVRTTFAYDEAHQLVESRTGIGDGARVARWRYDAAGRLVEETHDGETRTRSYDRAGQLTSARLPDGTTLRYEYDALGRRIAERGDGASRSYAWSPSGWLSAVVDRDAAGERRVESWVDGLGELARIDDLEVFLDSAAPYAVPAQVGPDPVVALGALTGSGGAWHAPGWRGVRADTADPWGAAGVGIGPAGELGLAGLEWLGARAYDPRTRGFLSVDPLSPVPGTAWSSNPYAYAGNDPLHAADPTGLRPATDADLKAYAAAHDGTGFGRWVENNWEYVAGGAMVLAGGVLIATGVGGPAGMMLVSAGADTIIQKATTGHVNWGEVAVSGAVGGFGGAGLAAKAGLTGMRATVAAGAASGALGGGATSGYTYLSGPGPHSVAGFAAAAGTGMGEGAVLGGAGGAAGHAIGGKIMGSLTHDPGASTMAMGRDMTQRVIPYADQHGYGYYKALPKPVYSFTEKVLPAGMHQQVHVWTNEKWINYQMMQGKDLVDIGAPAAWGPNPAPGPYYGAELKAVDGYPGYSQDPQPASDLR